MDRSNIFNIASENDFTIQAIELFKFQYKNIETYRKFVDLLNIDPNTVSEIKDIPCMPVELFKTHTILHPEHPAQIIFESSGTGSQIRSKHHISYPSIYTESIDKGFEIAYGKPQDLAIFALLPSYIERKNASLVYMVNHLIKRTSHNYGGFYLTNHKQLLDDINKAKSDGKKCILFGVSFALLDMIDAKVGTLEDVVIIETGGMKGRRKELTREELHNEINNGLKPLSIDSEYGMTELLSQGWSKDESAFKTPPWMKILIRDIHDPRSYVKNSVTGLINVIDLANIYSCAFLETKDLGKSTHDGFYVLGRMDNSDIRGCNLMVE